MNGISRCRHCQARIVKKTYALGDKWVHQAEGAAFSDGVTTYCETTIAQPPLHSDEPEYASPHVRRGSVTCSCGGWEPVLGESLARSFDKHLLAVHDEPDYPECEGHNEAQHRDGKPPWCSRCGWTRGQPARPALKIGKSSDERVIGSYHRPWTPENGYA